MNLNESNFSSSSIVEQILTHYSRTTNFTLLFTGFLFNLLLFIILLLVGRRECTTYFLLKLMSLCDFLYCLVHLSILLTIDQYVNIINRQILCPLSFFLTPFTFTGSTLLLLICLLHFITRYVRKYDTVLGQISGRLSVIFILAFILIRSILGSTSVELLSVEPHTPDVYHCTIDLNTPPLVDAVQKIVHVFAELTDILVYIGWAIIIFGYFINLIRCKPSYFYDPVSSTAVKPFSYSSSMVLFQNNSSDIDHQHGIVVIPMESIDGANSPNEVIRPQITNKQRHSDLSLIVLSIGIVSIFLYFPNIFFKYSMLHQAVFDHHLLNFETNQILQHMQQISHLFCLSLRILPYIFFDRRLHLFLHQLFGIQFMDTIYRGRSLRRGRRFRRRYRYVWNCQCRRRHRILKIQDEQVAELSLS